MICLHKNQNAYVAYNFIFFNYVMELKDFLRSQAVVNSVNVVMSKKDARHKCCYYGLLY